MINWFHDFGQQCWYWEHVVVEVLFLTLTVDRMVSFLYIYHLYLLYWQVCICHSIFSCPGD